MSKTSFNSKYYDRIIGVKEMLSFASIFAAALRNIRWVKPAHLAKPIFPTRHI